MKKIMMLLLALVLLTSPLVQAGFVDEPNYDHWVYENFQVLKEAGFLKGYPDGSFKGEEISTRYEMVAITARAFEKLEMMLNEKVDYEYLDKKFLSKKEVMEIVSDNNNLNNSDEIYYALQELEKEFRNELGEKDLRITTLENNFLNMKSEFKKISDENKKLRNDLDNLKEKHATTRIISYIGVILGIAGMVN